MNPGVTGEAASSPLERRTVAQGCFPHSGNDLGMVLCKITVRVEGARFCGDLMTHVAELRLTGLVLPLLVFIIDNSTFI